MRTTACAQLHALNCMLQKAVLSALVDYCGLLAKWLRARVRVRVGVRVRVRVRVRAGARECNRCTFFFPLVYKCGEHLSSLARIQSP